MKTEDVAELFPLPKRGYGGVLDAVRKLVKALDTQYFDHHCFIILLDRRTKAVQREVRQLIRGNNRFILGIAIEEIEAWWLADRTNTLIWSGLETSLPDSCRYAAITYRAERDKNPKQTLNELTELSSRFDRCYGQGNVDLATQFVADFWRDRAHLEEIFAQCPKGYAPFEKHVTDNLQRLRTTSNRLLD
jgi:hypothetical protein